MATDFVDVVNFYTWGSAVDHQIPILNVTGSIPVGTDNWLAFWFGSPCASCAFGKLEDVIAIGDKDSWIASGMNGHGKHVAR